MEQLYKHNRIEIAQSKRRLELNYRVENALTNQSVELNIKHTHHSYVKAAQRGIDAKRISTALEYGENFYRQGLVFYVLGEDNIPDYLLKERKKLQNTVVIVSGDTNEVITCYRSKKAPGRIKRKSKILHTGAQMRQAESCRTFSC